MYKTFYNLAPEYLQRFFQYTADIHESFWKPLVCDPNQTSSSLETLFEPAHEIMVLIT